MSKTIEVATTRHKQIVDVTDDVQQFVGDSGISEGLCHVFCLHTTSAVTTADLDPGTDLDMLDAFQAMVPKLRYRHPHDPSHVPDHIMSSIIGPGVLLPVAGGELVLGTWQRAVLVELDGPRKRQLRLTMLRC